MRAGPKRAITAEPLDFSDLGRPGWTRLQRFALEYVKVPKGHGARKPFKLRKWQLDIVKELYPSRGPRPRQGLVSMPRGNGKSGLAAVIALYALFADEEEGAQVLVVASDERQARIIFNACRRMIELDERLAEQVQIFQDRIYVPHTDSELRPLPAEPGALQGWDPSLVVVDELHVVTEAVYDAMLLAAGKRERSMLLAISTPGESTDSVMWRLVEHGRANTNDVSFKLVEYAAPEGCALDDEEAWKIANPALGDFLAVDAVRAQLRTTREPAFRRYRLGQWVGQVDRWLPWGAWEDLANPTRVVADREPVVLGFDGSASGDSTALVGCTVGPDPHVFVVGVWQNPGDVRWRVPRSDVDDAVAAAFDRYDVLELAADPWGWRSEIEAWAKRYGERRVLQWNTAAANRMAPATDRFYAAVTQSELSHDGNAVLATHLGNAVAKSTALGDLIHKDKRGSPRKIDAAVAAIVALDRAAFHSNKSARRRVRSFK
ncbi:terminase large subunit [Rhodococcus pyridinivorans]|uniref:terminase TerL endonuclease subunit n=1 Tax=Rhodococcus pyridinivorans TaxID=103816 RepID=UPI0020C673F6|nr:terminase TerL endonuclease subunit [Rhodococcus pyridinivorans]UTM38319.1 terminase large subunit [Rhodococcus pyridinivorans]